MSYQTWLFKCLVEAERNLEIAKQQVAEGYMRKEHLKGFEDEIARIRAI